MSDGDDSVAMSIEDAFAQTLSDMEDAREELASSPVESASPSLNSAFEVGVADVSEEAPEQIPLIAPASPTPVDVTPSPPLIEAPQGPPMGGSPAGPPMDSPPTPPSIEPISETEDHESTLQVADLSEITTNIQTQTFQVSNSFLS